MLHLSYKVSLFKFIVTVFTVSFIFFLIPFQVNAALTDGLVGYWKMNNNWLDSTNNNNGAANNGVAFSSSSKLGSAAGSFDSSNDYVSVPDSNSLDLTTAGTISFWMKKTSNKNYQMYVTKSTNGYQILDYGTTGRISVRWGNDSDSLISSSTVSTSTWNFVTATYSGAQLSIYINGVLDATTTYSTSATANTELLRIGSRSDGYYYGGLLDSVMIYNRALSASEVSSLYNSGSGLDLTTLSLEVTSPATSVASTTATLNGILADDGGASTTVTVYWGATDGGTTTGNWANSVSLGTTTSSSTFSTDITGLTGGTTYYFRIKGSNSVGDSWSPVSQAFGYYTDAQLTANILGYWKMNSNWLDSSGNGNNGYISGSPTFGTGKIGSSSGVFDGSSYVNIPNTALFTGTASRTLTTWFKTTSTNDGLIMYAQGGNGYNGSRINFGLNMDGNTGKIGTEFENVTVTYKGSNLNDGNWHQASFSYNGTYYKTYIDGVLKASEVLSLNNQEIVSGKIGGATIVYNNFIGSIDDMMSFNRLLSDGEIAALYNAGSGRELVTRPSVTVSPATNVASTTATLNGTLADDGAASTTVTVYWGTTDGGTTTANWANSVALGTTTASSTFSTNLTGLTASTTYYFRAKAVNSAGTTWSSVSLKFKYVLAWSCGNDDIVDTRDGQNYSTVKLGTQCWMKQNLNVGTYNSASAGNYGTACSASNGSDIAKYCYSNDTANCTNYGGLYTWGQSMCGATTAGAQGICPTGWHIPTHDEFTTLERAVCTSGTCATDFPYDTTTTGWRGTNEGTTLMSTTSSRFSALMSGELQYLGDDYFAGLGSYTRFLSSSILTSMWGPSGEWGRQLTSGTALVDRESYYGSESANPVRCVRDDVVTISAATNIASTTATLNGHVVNTLGGNPNVTIYWGDNDGGTTTGNWDHAVSLGTTTVGAFSTNLTGLIHGTVYYFAARGVNTEGDSWSPTSLSFRYYSDSDLTNGMTGLYHMNNDWTDLSGNGNDGTSNGNATFGTAKLGAAAGTFDGDGDYISLSTLPSSGSQSFTISSWIKTTYIWQREQIVSYGSNAGTGQGAWFFVSDSGYLSFDLTNTTGPVSSVSVADDAWHLATVVNNAGTVQLYVDGVPSGSSVAMSPNIQTGSQIIGAAVLDSSESWPFIGLLDETSIWNRALSANEISAMYNLGTGRELTVSNNVTVSAATNITGTTATLNGTLIGSGSPTVTVYWGDNDGGTTTGNWDHAVSLGATSAGAFSTNITGLTAGTMYYFNAKVTNAEGDIWSQTSQSFVYCPDSNLLGYWKMNNDWLDYSNNHNSGTAYGNATFSTTSPNTKLGAASMVLDGSGDYLKIPANASFDFGTGNFAVSMWVKLNSPSAYQHLIGTDTSGDLMIALNSPSTGINVGTHNGSWNFSSAYTFTTNWTYVTVTRNSGVISAYVNGNFISSSTNTTSYNTDSIYIGAHPGVNYVNGDIDDVAIYNRALSASEISSSYNSGAGQELFMTSISNPSLTVTPATNLASTTATLNGTLSSDGGASTTVTVYWGTTDGGTTTANWTNAVSLGTTTSSSTFSTNLTGLTAGTTYYFRAKAVNSAGTTWASSTQNFKYYTDTELSSGLVGYWKMNNNWLDSSGNNNTGTAYNGATFSTTTANTKLGSTAGYFDGSDDYVDVANESNFDLTAFTFSAWVNAFDTPPTNNWRSIVTKGDDGPFTIATMSSASCGSGGEFGAGMNDGSFENVCSGIVPTPNTWYHVVVTDTGTTRIIYINGVNRGTITHGTAHQNNYNLRLGTNGATGGRYWKGIIDDAIIYNRALSSSEISALYNAGSGRELPGISAPTLTLNSVTNVAISTATLSGNLTSAGGTSTVVTLYWGTTDGGTTTANWTNSMTALTSSVANTFSKNISGLLANTKYYFTAKAANFAGTTWTSTQNFTTTQSGTPILQIKGGVKVKGALKIKSN